MTYQDLLIQNKQQSQRLEENSQLIEALQFEIAKLKKLIFGAKRERFTSNVDATAQSTLFVYQTKKVVDHQISEIIF